MRIGNSSGVSFASRSGRATSTYHPTSVSGAFNVTNAMKLGGDFAVDQVVNVTDCFQIAGAAIEEANGFWRPIDSLGGKLLYQKTSSDATYGLQRFTNDANNQIYWEDNKWKVQIHHNLTSVVAYTNSDDVDFPWLTSTPWTLTATNLADAGEPLPMLINPAPQVYLGSSSALGAVLIKAPGIVASGGIYTFRPDGNCYNPIGLVSNTSLSVVVRDRPDEESGIWRIKDDSGMLLYSSNNSSYATPGDVGSNWVSAMPANDPAPSSSSVTVGALGAGALAFGANVAEDNRTYVVNSIDFQNVALIYNAINGTGTISYDGSAWSLSRSDVDYISTTAAVWLAHDVTWSDNGGGLPVPVMSRRDQANEDNWALI